MNMHGIYLFWEEKMGYIMYSNRINASISVLQREMDCLNKGNENQDFRENMDFDLQNNGQSHSFNENMK